MIRATNILLHLFLLSRAISVVKNEFATNINDPASPTVPGSTTINVVNYKIVKDAIKAAGNKMKSKDLSTYSMGGLYTYFAAMDDATSFDPNTYFTSTDNSKKRYQRIYKGCFRQGSSYKCGKH